jgi:hypothetical protein
LLSGSIVATQTRICSDPTLITVSSITYSERFSFSQGGHFLRIIFLYLVPDGNMISFIKRNLMVFQVILLKKDLKNKNTNHFMYSEGVLFLESIKEMEHLRAIDLSLNEQSPIVIYSYSNSLFLLSLVLLFLMVICKNKLSSVMVLFIIRSIEIVFK